VIYPFGLDSPSRPDAEMLKLISKFRGAAVSVPETVRCSAAVVCYGLYIGVPPSHAIVAHADAAARMESALQGGDALKLLGPVLSILLQLLQQYLQGSLQ
jgi:hypothetical protein